MIERELIRILNNIAILLELKGENPFKSRAYTKAAEIIENENLDIRSAVRNNTLKDIKGFGKALVTKISDYAQNGNMEYYNRLTAEVPESLIDLTKLSNLGPKKVRQLWLDLNITTIEELEMACQNGMLLKIKGFAEKTIEMISNSIEHKKASKGRYLQYAIKQNADKILSFLKSMDEVEKAEITGDVRRFTETITNLHFLIASESAEIIKNKILESSLNLTLLDTDSQIINFETEQKIPVKIELVPYKIFFKTLHETTGGEIYLSGIEAIAEKEGIDINTFSIDSEEKLYELLKLQYIPPELRESIKVIESAKSNNVPKLIERSDLKGMLHVHSTWTDGHNSIKEMALKSKELGFSYMVLSDHSQSAVYD